MPVPRCIAVTSTRPKWSIAGLTLGWTLGMGVVVSFVKILPKRRFIRILFYLFNLNKLFVVLGFPNKVVWLGEVNNNEQTKGLRQAPRPRHFV